MQQNHIQLAALLETRVKESKARKIATTVVPGWEIHHNYHDVLNGRIWLLWDNTIFSVDVLQIEAQFTHCMVKGRLDGFECVLTIVYGYNIVEYRKSLWNSLITMASNCAKPWVIGGDFNGICIPMTDYLATPFPQLKLDISQSVLRM